MFGIARVCGVCGNGGGTRRGAQQAGLPAACPTTTSPFPCRILTLPPSPLLLPQGGAVMSSHAGELELTQALLDRPAFDYCFCMKVRSFLITEVIRSLVSNLMVVFDYFFCMKVQQNSDGSIQLAVAVALCASSGMRSTCSMYPLATLQTLPFERSVPPPSCPLQDYLPPVLHATFLAAVTEFVWLPWKAAQEAGAAVASATQGGSQVRGGGRLQQGAAAWVAGNHSSAAGAPLPAPKPKPSLACLPGGARRCRERGGAGGVAE